MHRGAFSFSKQPEVFCTNESTRPTTRTRMSRVSSRIVTVTMNRRVWLDHFRDHWPFFVVIPSPVNAPRARSTTPTVGELPCAGGAEL